MLGERFVLRLPVEERAVTMDEPFDLNDSSKPAEFDEAAWTTVRDEALGCTKCDLCRTRTQVVWGSGTPRTGIMVVGEAPGYHEDQQGEAFVGRAGQLLTKILAAIGFGRDEVFITNVLKCRPPDNADPLPHQVESCEPYLKRQIAIIDPAVILTLGRHAARTLLGVDSTMGAMRGRVFRYEEVPLVATYHPAALLRNPKLKRPTWEDVQLAREIYDEEMERRGKKIYPNVDFFSASVYTTLGIAMDLFTPIFAMSRVTGWTAHLFEQYANNRLIRPKAEYTGPRGLKVEPLENR
ncbi:MAG: uracil-DNA glycosylase [Gemmatimonadetes bacterium]|nr:uracil-DNA glycosylase [Gemmatimonadota bacterium]